MATGAVLELQGEHALILFPGYKVELAWSKAWALEVSRQLDVAEYFERLWVFQGPKGVFYEHREMNFAPLLAFLSGEFSGQLVLVAHSSGSFPCHILLQTILASPVLRAKYQGRVHYVNLDGGMGRGDVLFTAEMASILASGRTVSVVDRAQGGYSANHQSMEKFAEKFPSVFVHQVISVYEPEANKLSLHDAVINSAPYDKCMYDLKRDYSEFNEQHPVNVDWLLPVLAKL